MTYGWRAEPAGACRTGRAQVVPGYSRRYRLPEVRQALDRWGEHGEELINKASKIPTAATAPGTPRSLGGRELRLARALLSTSEVGAEEVMTVGHRANASSDTLETECEMTVAVDIPDDLERRLRDGWADMPRKVLEAVALEAYRSGALTGAEVQRLLGLESRWDLEAFLRQAGVCLDYDQADLARDLEAFRQSGMP